MSGDFPGRPDHPDLWLLAQALTEMDAQAESPQHVRDIIGRYLDPDSVTYVAIQRAIRVRTMLEPTALSISQLSGTWIDGFITGMMVQHLKTTADQEQERRS